MKYRGLNICTSGGQKRTELLIWKRDCVFRCDVSSGISWSCNFVHWSRLARRLRRFWKEIPVGFFFFFLPRRGQGMWRKQEQPSPSAFFFWLFKQNAKIYCRMFKNLLNKTSILKAWIISSCGCPWLAQWWLRWTLMMSINWHGDLYKKKKKPVREMALLQIVEHNSREQNRRGEEYKVVPEMGQWNRNGHTVNYCRNKYVSV